MRKAYAAPPHLQIKKPQARSGAVCCTTRVPSESMRRGKVLG